MGPLRCLCATEHFRSFPRKTTCPRQDSNLGLRLEYFVFSGILPLDYGGKRVSHTGYRTRSSGLKGQYPKPCRPYGKRVTAVGFEPTHKKYWILRPTPWTTRTRCRGLARDRTVIDGFKVHRTSHYTTRPFLLDGYSPRPSSHLLPHVGVEPTTFGLKGRHSDQLS